MKLVMLIALEAICIRGVIITFSVMPVSLDTLVVGVFLVGVCAYMGWGGWRYVIRSKRLLASHKISQVHQSSKKKHINNMMNVDLERAIFAGLHLNDKKTDFFIIGGKRYGKEQ